MHIKKICLSLVIFLGLSFFNPISPMFNGWFGKSKEEQERRLSEENRLKEQEKNCLIECGSRLQKCVDNNTDPDPKDLFDIWYSRSDIVEILRELIEKAIKIRNLKHNFLEDPSKITINNPFRIIMKGGPNFNYRCPICNGHIYFHRTYTRKAYAFDKDGHGTSRDEEDEHYGHEHKDECLRRIMEEKEALVRKEAQNIAQKNELLEKSQACLAKLRLCVDSNTDPDPEDLFYACQDPKFAEQNKDIIQRAKDIRKLNNTDIIEKAKIINLKCACASCNSPIIPTSNPINCPICLKVFYCNQECMDEDKIWIDNHKECCLKNILEEKEMRKNECFARLRLCIFNDTKPEQKDLTSCWNRLKEKNAKGEAPDPEDLFYAFKDTRNDAATWNTAKAKRISCSKSEDRQKEFQKNSKCSNCNENLTEIESYCSLCSKAFFCKKCKTHSKQDCLRSILAEKEKTNLLNPVKNNQGEEKIIIEDKKVTEEPTKIDDKLFFKGTCALFDAQKKIKPMVVNDLELELVCEDAMERIYRSVPKNNKIFQNEEPKNIDGKYFFKSSFAFFDEKKTVKPMIINDLELELVCEDAKQSIYRSIKEKKDIYNKKEGNFDFSDHIRDYKKDNNLDYISLNTVDHTDKKITSCVAMKYSKIKSFNNSNEKLICFFPEGTCGVQSIRNAFLMNAFLTSKEYDRLKDINDRLGAKAFLRDTLKGNMTTSFLDAIDIEGRIGEMDLDEKVIVFNSVLEIKEKQQKEVRRIIKNFKDKNYSHIFILNTADIASLDKLDEHREAYQKREHCKIDEKSFTEFKSKQENPNNWYVVAIDKRENNMTHAVDIACLVVDTESEDSQLKDKVKLSRNRALCEFILNEDSTALDAFKATVTGLSKAAISNAVDTGKLKKDISSNTQRLMTQEDIEMSESLQNSIYKAAPGTIRYLIESYKKATKENSTEKTKSQVDHLPQIFILHGPSGTGKSDIARVFAKKTGRKIFFVNCGLLGTSMQYSESENLKNEIFPVLELGKENVPCLVVLDEADALTRKNGKENRDSGSAAAAIGSILDACKNYDITFICTTNHLGDLIPKLVDRARYYLIEVSLPDLNAKKEILKYLILERAKKSKITKKVSVKFESLDLDLIAKNTDGCSIRMLESIVNEVYTIAYNKKILDEVVFTDQDFIEQCNLFKNRKAEFEKSIEEKK